jgi:hypothetical protein
MDQTRLAFVNALIGHRVVARFMGAFQGTPLMAQAKVALQKLEQRAAVCEKAIQVFKREVQQEVDNYNDWMGEMLPDQLKRATDPIFKMLGDVVKGKLAADDMEDVKKAGIDLTRLANAAARDAGIDKRQKETIESIEDTGKEIIKTVEETLSKEIPPLSWWTKNLEQVSMIANMHVESPADKALVEAIEKLAKTTKIMFTVGAGLEEALEDIQVLTGKALKALKSVSVPEEPGALPGVPGAKPKRKPGAPKDKKPTFAEVRKAIFERLRKDGWTLQEKLQIPHATSPDGQWRLWFKAQSVYINDPQTDPRAFKNTHSMISDLRELADPNAFMRAVERHMKD